MATSQSKDCDVARRTDRQLRDWKVIAFGLVLYLLLPRGLWAETPVRAPHRDIDHVAACGIFQLKKDYRRALDHCNAALQGDPDDDQSLSNRGSAHFALGNHEEALRDFNAAMRLKPADARNYFNRALVHAARKDHVHAIADYDEAIRLMPDLAIAYNNRAREYEATGEREKAITDYRAALRLAPSLGAIIRHNLRGLGAEP